MKHIILITVFFFLANNLFAQAAHPCYIKYLYDDSGNRINRKFICAPVDSNDGNVPQRPLLIVADEGFMQDFIVSPNPSNGNYELQFINMQAVNHVDVYNQLGQLILTKKQAENFDRIDLTNQAAGMYYFILRGNKKAIIRKVLKVE